MGVDPQGRIIFDKIHAAVLFFVAICRVLATTPFWPAPCAVADPQ